MLKPIQCTNPMWLDFKKKYEKDVIFIKNLHLVIIETSESMLNIGAYLENNLLFKIDIRLDNNKALAKFLHDYIDFDGFKSIEELLYTVIDSYKDHLNKILSKIE